MNNEVESIIIQQPIYKQVKVNTVDVKMFKDNNGKLFEKEEYAIKSNRTIELEKIRKIEKEEKNSEIKILSDKLKINNKLNFPDYFYDFNFMAYLQDTIDIERYLSLSEEIYKYNIYYQDSGYFKKGWYLVSIDDNGDSINASINRVDIFLDDLKNMITIVEDGVKCVNG